MTKNEPCCHQMSRIHATNMGVHEKPNTNSATATTATTKQSATLKKPQKPAEKKVLN